MRTLLIRFENLNTQVFEGTLMPGVNKSTLKAHVRNLCHLFTRATYPELMATATVFGIPVYFCTQAPSGFYRWKVVQAMRLSKYQFKLPVLPFPEDVLPTALLPHHFEISYTQNYQYDCVVSLAGEACGNPPLLSGSTSSVD